MLEGNGLGLIKTLQVLVSKFRDQFLNSLQAI
jgi:hypothetical protein